MKAFISIIILSALIVGTSLAQTIKMSNGHVFDGEKFQLKDFWIKDGKITFLKPAHIDQTIDIGSKYVIPPFGEAHNHSIDQRWGLEARLNDYLTRGIFYYKNPNSIPRLTNQLSGLINLPHSVDVSFANGGLTTSGGHPTVLYNSIWEGGLKYAFQGKTKDVLIDQAYYTIDSKQELDAKWKRIIDDKPDFIKVYLLYSEDFDKRKDMKQFEGKKGLDPKLVPLIVEKAHKQGLRVSAHIETAYDFHIAVEAGVDEINHLPAFMYVEDSFSYEIAEEDAYHAKQKGIIVVPTYSLLESEYMKGIDPSVKDKVRAIQIHNLKLLNRVGVKIAIGCDYYKGTAHDELNYLRDLGIFSNLELINMYTIHSALTIFPERRIGSLKEGYEASFLVLTANPLIQLEAIEQIEIYFKEGQQLDLVNEDP